jgi:uncharacterized membrane protein (UPF0127 family)
MKPRRSHVAAPLLLLLGLLAAPPPAARAAGAAPHGTTAPSALPTVPATIGGAAFTLEVARDGPAMYRGLGGRTHIAPNGGMVFVFPVPQPLTFVMRDCPIPIDVAFLDDAGRVINSFEMHPEPPRAPGEDPAHYDERLYPYRSALPARYAVEMAGGRLRALGVGSGSRIVIDWGHEQPAAP